MSEAPRNSALRAGYGVLAVALILSVAGMSLVTLPLYGAAAVLGIIGATRGATRAGVLLIVAAVLTPVFFLAARAGA